MIAALFFSLLVFAQTNLQQNPPEYGDISELKSLHRVYIYTDNPASHDRIAKELAKYKGLEVVGRIADSEFVLTFFGASVSRGTGSTVYIDPNTGVGSGSTYERYAHIGNMQAVVPGSQPSTIRILWHTDKNTKFRFGKDPEIKCAQEFIKQLQKVREEK